MRRSRKPFRGRFLRRGFESLPLRLFGRFRGSSCFAGQVACCNRSEGRLQIRPRASTAVNARRDRSANPIFVPPPFSPSADGRSSRSPRACSSTKKRFAGIAVAGMRTCFHLPAVLTTRANRASPSEVPAAPPAVTRAGSQKAGAILPLRLASNERLVLFCAGQRRGVGQCSRRRRLLECRRPMV